MGMASAARICHCMLPATTTYICLGFCAALAAAAARLAWFLGGGGTGTVSVHASMADTLLPTHAMQLHSFSLG